ncbi:MAG: hypothetical protein ACHREM_10965 [Polyangiales bacterium]
MTTIASLRRARAHGRNDEPSALAASLDELVCMVAATAPGSAERIGLRTRIDAAIATVPLLHAARMRQQALVATEDASLEAWRALAAIDGLDDAMRSSARAEVAARDPADEENLTAMREAARTSRDPVALVEALVRGLARGITTLTPELRASRAAELAMWADEHLRDPALAAWAWERARASDPGDDKLAAQELRRLEPKVSRAEARLREALASVAQSSGEIRNEARREAIQALASRLDRSGQLLDLIDALLSEAPSDRVALAALDRVAPRLSTQEATRALRLREDQVRSSGKSRDRR